jgi:hypothetical protein
MKVASIVLTAVLAMGASLPVMAKDEYQYTYCMATTSRGGVLHYIFSAPYQETPERLLGETIDQSMTRVTQLHAQASKEFGEFRDRQNGFRNKWTSTDCRQPGTFMPKPASTREQAIKNALAVMKHMTEANGMAGPILTDFVPSWARDNAKTVD